MAQVGYVSAAEYDRVKTAPILKKIGESFPLSSAAD
jgi:hypothetical protein